MNSEPAAKPKFDSTAAWNDARAMLRGNREMLLGVAGVFFLLPGLIGAVILPELAVREDMSEQQMSQTMLDYYSQAGPILLLLSLPLATGFMTMLKLMLDPARPTVGASILASLKVLPNYLAASFITGMALTLAWVLAATVAVLILPPLLAVPLALFAMSWPLVRLMFATPEIAVRHTLNPFRAIGRSWAATRRAYWPLLGYFGPAVAVFLVASSLLMLIIAIVLSQAGEGSVQRLASEAILYAAFALGYTVLAALVASAWKQLAPPAG